jgi:hypothetical protein
VGLCEVVDLFRYVLFRTEAWTVTGTLLMAAIYLSQLLDASRPRDSAGAVVGVVLTGAIGTGLLGGVCAALWQVVRKVAGRGVPSCPELWAALAVARPGMLKGAVIGFAVCLLIGLAMSGLFVLTRERTGMLLGSRIAWQIGCGLAGGALGAAIASVGGLRGK